MRRIALAVGVALAGLGFFQAGTVAQPAPPASAPRDAAMTPFTSDEEFARFLKQVQARAEARAKAAERAERRRNGGMLPPPPPPPPPMAMAPSPVAAAESSADSAAAPANPSITNTQEADVDEGGIVKVVGEHLVILRRGRLFTVSTGDRAMRAIDHVDAYPPGTSGAGSWYDEMLVSGDRVIVVGFSYARGGTELNRFRVARDGKLRYEDSYHLRGNDYYSSTNYASRLIGTTLVFYTPLYLNRYAPLDGLPGVRRWTGDTRAPYRRSLDATQLYVPTPVRRSFDDAINTLHTVTRCDLTAPELACRSTAVLGTNSRNFYVSGNAVYVWTGLREMSARSGAFVYRLPLDGSAPGAVQAWGGPVDQFSFREDRAARLLQVVVRANSRGEAMWRAERSEGATALLTLPLDAFGNGSRVAPPAAYRPLPLNRDPWNFRNRFVGRHLIYVAGNFDAKAGVKTVFAAPLDGGPIAQVPVPHGVDRLDIIGGDAIAIGNDAKERLGFSAIELSPAAAARLGDTYFLPSAREGERRSQAFFFRPDNADGTSGMLGLPVSRNLDRSRVARFLGSGSAIAFLRRDARKFSPAGELVANAEGARADNCQASCVDWYGNARPIFLGDRVFALMGYELVEGRTSGGLIGERARLDFAPGGR